MSVGLFILAVVGAVGLHTSVATAQPSTPYTYRVGFYNVENLCDTLRSDFYDDSDYTPTGALRWGKERYGRKLRAVGQVIDQLGCDIVGLAEVESEEALKDLVMVLEEDYCYIHRTTSDFRGMDQALLYKADRFYPEEIRQIDVGTSRQVLHIKGELWDEPIELLVWHAPSNLQEDRYRHRSLARFAHVADSLASRGGSVAILADLNCTPEEPIFQQLFLGDRWLLPTVEGTPQGIGSYEHNGQWELIDHIILSEKFATLFDKIVGSVFAPPQALTNHQNSPQYAPRGIPLRTFEGRTYRGGASDHLPVKAIWE